MAVEFIRDIAEILGVVLGLWTLHLFVVLVHESGHAVGASLLGLKVNQICVGPFLWKRRTGVSFNRSFARLLDGQVMAQFPTVAGTSAWKYFVFIAAGPVASLALIVAAAPFSGDADWRSVIAAIVLLDSFVVAIVTLIPMRLSDGRTSDGQKIWMLLFSSKQRSRLLYSVSVHARVEALKQHWERRQFEPVLHLADEMLHYSREVPSLMANEKWKTAVEKLRLSALKGIENPESVELECSEHPQILDAPPAN